MAEAVSAPEEQAVSAEPVVTTEPEALEPEVVVAADAPADDAPSGTADDTAVTPEPEADGEPSDLDSLTQRYPWLTERLTERDRDRENAGAQRREAQLRREAGSKEQTARAVAHAMREWGVDPAEVGEQGSQRMHFLYDLAATNAAWEFAREVPEAISKFAIPVEAREAAVRIKEQSPQDFDSYVRTLFDGAVEQEVTKREATIRKDMEREIGKRVQAELKAQGIEGKPRAENIPASPRGTPVNKPLTSAELDARYNSNQWINLPADERARLLGEALEADRAVATKGQA